MTDFQDNNNYISTNYAKPTMDLKKEKQLSVFATKIFLNEERGAVLCLGGGGGGSWGGGSTFVVTEMREHGVKSTSAVKPVRLIQFQDYSQKLCFELWARRSTKGNATSKLSKH